MKPIKFEDVKYVYTANECEELPVLKTGITRKIDDLGRVVIPMETRKVLNINVGDSLEIYVDGDTIILRKYELKVCENCGNRIDDDDFYCKHCGKVQI